MGFAQPDDRKLRRIAALLVAFAALAERAGGRSFPVRWFVLTVLRHAEAVARTFVIETTQIDWPCCEDPLEFHGSPLEAAWLAACFRALAAVLLALLPAARPFDFSRIDCPPRRLQATPVGFLPRAAAGRGSQGIRRCAHDPPRRFCRIDPTGHVAKPLRGPPAQAVRAAVYACAGAHPPCVASFGSTLNRSLPGTTFRLD